MPATGARTARWAISPGSAPGEPSARHLRVDRYTSGHGLRKDAVHPCGKRPDPLGGPTVIAHVHVVVPQASTTPRGPAAATATTGGSATACARRGWDRATRSVAGPGPAWTAALGSTLPDGALVLVDGLVASAAGAVLVPEADRLRLVVLVHMPLGGGGVPEADEAPVLAGARAVVTTSAWTRQRLLERYRLRPDRVARRAPGHRAARGGARDARTADGCCASARSPRTRARTCCWRHSGAWPTSAGAARWSGPLDRDPAFVASQSRTGREAGIADRVRMPGTRGGRGGCATATGDADLLVLPSPAGELRHGRHRGAGRRRCP